MAHPAPPDKSRRRHDVTLDAAERRLLALWAADCTEHVLHLYEDHHPTDDRPRQAIVAIRAWVRGEIRVGQARAAALAAHAAATAHVVTHAAGPTLCAVRAVAAAASAGEHAWQAERLPEHLWSVGFPRRGHSGST